MPLSIVSKRKLFAGKFITLWSTEFLDKEGHTHEWEWIRGHDFVVVLPILDTKNILLIRNWRVPVERYVFELPAGMIDATDPDPASTAHRELIEETGYEAGELLALPPIPHAPGNSTSMIYPFIATKLKKISDQQGDQTEDISIVSMPVDNVVSDYLNGRQEEMFNLRIIALLHIAISKGLCILDEK